MSETRPVIRTEQPADAEAINDVQTAAFVGRDEAQLVDVLRSSGAVLVSMVAELDGVVVGHALFTRAHIAWSDAEQPVAALGPMAVSPAHQRQGIGGELIASGLAACRALGETAVIVLGHAEYYPKFGFVPSDTYGVDCEFAVPREVFMLLPFAPDALAGSKGVAKYHPAFHDS